MNQKIKDHVFDVYRKQYPGAPRSPLEQDIIDYIIETDPIHEEDCGSCRWWMNTFRVVEIDGMLIGFDYASTTGDDSPRDKGWEFDPDSICEVERKEEVKIVVSYEIKKEK